MTTQDGVTLIKGELRYFAEAYSLPGSNVPQHRAVLHIYDGEKFILFESNEGIEVVNSLLRAFGEAEDKS